MTQIGNQPYPYTDTKDRLTNAIIGIDFEHHMVHKGDTYTVSYLSKGVANNGYLDIHVTGVTNDAHIKISYSSEGKSYFNSYAGTTYSNQGTSITPFNRCICQTNTATTLVRHTPVINVLGTLRTSEFIGSSGAAVVRAGGTGGGNIESIVNPGYDLLVRLQNVSGSASDLQITLNFYELEPDA